MDNYYLQGLLLEREQISVVIISILLQSVRKTRRLLLYRGIDKRLFTWAWEVVARPLFFAVSAAVFASMLWWGIGAGSGSALCSTATRDTAL